MNPGMRTDAQSDTMERMNKTYRYEMHMHTRESSWCGQVPGARAAALHAEAGYDGICVTDHYFRAAIDALPARRDADRVRMWLNGFNAVYDEGRRQGLQVLLCMELRFDENPNDYLVYGMTEDLLIRHPDLYTMNPSTFSPFAERHGLFFAQAHPYRNMCVPAMPCDLHGIEVFNGNRRHDSHNDRALALAEGNPHLIRLSGSDFHQETDLAGASMQFEEKLTDSPSMARALREDRILGNDTKAWTHAPTPLL